MAGHFGSAPERRSTCRTTRQAGDEAALQGPPYGGIRAIDLATGSTIWDRPVGLARANGPFGIPSVLPYEASGGEYLAIMAGGHHFMETPIGDHVIAYALPQ